LLQRQRLAAEAVEQEQKEEEFHLQQAQVMQLLPAPVAGCRHQSWAVVVADAGDVTPSLMPAEFSEETT
jgi:hypothetical protein